MCSTKDNATKSKSTKKGYKARIQKQSTKYKLKVLLEYLKSFKRKQGKYPRFIKTIKIKTKCKLD